MPDTIDRDPQDRELRVFVSHAGVDTAAARALAESLRRQGFAVWFDKDDIRPGEPWMAALESAIGNASAMVVYVGTLGVQNWVDREIRYGLELSTRQPDRFRLIPVLGEGADATRLPPFLAQHQYIDLRDSARAPDELRRLFQSLSSRSSPAAIPHDYWRSHSPFRSLRSFEPEDSWLFFGRDRETDEMLERLRRSPVLFVSGNSGSGKSSLVRAGLIPALRRGRFQSNGSSVDSWRIAIVRPTHAPFDELAEVLPRELTPEHDEGRRSRRVTELKQELPANDFALRNALSQLPRGSRILLVVDQFEELFTLFGTGDQSNDEPRVDESDVTEVRRRYIANLLNAARMDSDTPVHVVFVLRADFWAHCFEHRDLKHSLEENLYCVSLLGRDQLRDAIRMPAALAGVSVETDLVDSLLTDTGTEPGNLALLEHALQQLWDQRSDSRNLTSSAYTTIGRLKGALGKHADKVYREIQHPDHQRIAERIFLELVHFGENAPDTRRRVPKDAMLRLGATETIEQLLTYLASARLITVEATPGQANGAAFVEVAHEALIRDWPSLRKWVEKDRLDLTLERRLVDQATAWATEREPEMLLRGRAMAAAEEWLTAHPDKASLLLVEFIGTSMCAARDVEERERSRQLQLLEAAKAKAEAQEVAAKQARQLVTRSLRFSIAIGTVALVAIGAAITTYRQQRVASALALAAKAGEMLARGNRPQAIDYAVRSWSEARTSDGKAALALVATAAVLAGHTDQLFHATFSPDSRLIATVGRDQSVRIWTNEGQLLAELRGHTSWITRAKFSPDSKRVATTAAFDNFALIWDVASHTVVSKLVVPTKEVAVPEQGLALLTQAVALPLEGMQDIEFSPSGETIVTSSEKEARLWNAATGEAVAVLDGPAGHPVFSPDGKLILTSGAHVALTNAATGLSVVKFIGHTGEVRDAEFSRDGTRIVTAGADKTVRIWNAADGRQLTALAGPADPAVKAAFSFDGRSVITLSAPDVVVDGKPYVSGGPDTRTALDLWDAETGKHLAQAGGHVGQIASAEFSPDGATILTAGADGTIRLWNAATLQGLATLPGDMGNLNEARYSPDGLHIIAVGSSMRARLWNTTYAQLVALLPHTASVYDAEFSPREDLVVSTGNDAARIWSIPSGALRCTLRMPDHAPEHEYMAAAFLADGASVVTADADAVARRWDARACSEMKTFTTAPSGFDYLDGVAVSRNNRRLVTMGGSEIGLWNLISGDRIATLSKTSGGRAWLSPIAGEIATATYDGVQMWREDDGQHLLTIPGTSAPQAGASFRWLAFSPDGRKLAAAGGVRPPQVWNAKTGELIRQIDEGPVGDWARIAFAPDSQRIVTTAEDGSVDVWDVSSAKRTTTIHPANGHALSAVFSVDGRRLLTTGSDKRALIWDISTGHLVAELSGHDDEIRHAVFSPSGAAIATASSDGHARVFKLTTLIELARLITDQSP